MLRHAALVLALFALTAACTDDSPGLFVELKTDLRPGIDFALARVKVYDGPIVEGDTPLRETRDSVGSVDPVLEGHRVAEVEGLSPGTYYVEMTLLDDAMEFVASRTVVVDLRQTLAIVVAITRDCRAVRCPTSADPTSATSCVGGACADPVCTEADCSPVECTSAGECPAPDACATAACEEGICFYRYEDTRCASDEICDPERGCMSVGIDAAVPDAGPDGGVDADAGPPEPALLLWLELEDTPADGVDDSSSIPVTGTCVDGCPTVVPGRIGSAYQFDGVGYLTFQDPIFDVDTEFSVACWVLPAIIASGDSAVAKPRGGRTGNSYKLWITRAGETSWETSTGSAGDITTLHSYIPDEWVHLAGVWTGTEKVLYVNGVEVARAPETASAFDDSPVVIGADINDGLATSHFEGLIDEVRIYRRALSESEVAALSAIP